MEIILTPFEENLDTILEEYNYYSMTTPEKRRFKNLIIRLNNDEFLLNAERNMSATETEKSRAAKYNEILTMITNDIFECEKVEHQRQDPIKRGLRESMRGWGQG